MNSLLNGDDSRLFESEAFADGMKRKAKELDEYIEATLGMLIRDKKRDDTDFQHRPCFYSD